MSNLGTPLRVIQEISGHESLAELQEYLEVSDEQLEQAIAQL
jgi:integrase/recombinase XerD